MLGNISLSRKFSMKQIFHSNQRITRVKYIFQIFIQMDMVCDKSQLCIHQFNFNAKLISFKNGKYTFGTWNGRRQPTK